MFQTPHSGRSISSGQLWADLPSGALSPGCTEESTRLPARSLSQKGCLLPFCLDEILQRWSWDPKPQIRFPTHVQGSDPRRRQVWERLLGSTEMTGAPSPLVYKAQPEPQWLQPTRGKCPEFSCQPCEWGWWKRHRRTLPRPT